MNPEMIVCKIKKLNIYINIGKHILSTENDGISFKNKGIIKLYYKLLVSCPEKNYYYIYYQENNNG